MPRDTITLTLLPKNNGQDVACDIHEGKKECGEFMINTKTNKVTWVDFYGQENRALVYAAACVVAAYQNLKDVQFFISGETEGSVKSARLLVAAGFECEPLHYSRFCFSLPIASVKCREFIIEHLPDYIIEKSKRNLEKDK